MARGDWPLQDPIEFRVPTWRAKVGSAWPSAPERGRLSRQDVFQVSDAHRQGTATGLQLLVAVGIWGYAKGGRGGYRVQHWLEDDGVASKIDAVIDLARVADFEAAYESLLRSGTNYVHGLGPAFFTKLLYFAAYERGADGVQPLILDQFVALGLRQRTRDWWPTTGWTSAQYLRYLETARDLADGPDGMGEPDLIEFELFRFGKQT